MKLRIALAVLILAVPLGAAAPGHAATVTIDVSNFRFCPTAPCLPTDVVYVRNPTGNGLIWQNALAATLIFRTEVHPGDTVVWTYKDALCDAISGCPGHAVCFENLTAEGDCGTRILDARKGEVTVSFTVPSITKDKKLLRYFCNVNNHYAFGMTGALLVRK
jgi:plastocyanin